MDEFRKAIDVQWKRTYLVSSAFLVNQRTIAILYLVYTVPSIGALALRLRSSCVTKPIQHTMVQQKKNKTRGRNFN